MEKRDVTKPTLISICLPGPYILIKDLEGNPHIVPQSDEAEIGRKVLELARNQSLPQCDVGKISVSDSETVVNAGQEGFDVNNISIDDLNPDSIKKELIKGLFGFMKGATDYPRSNPKPKAKK